MPVAGWYTDPGNEEQLRYWDGERWLEYTKERPAPTPPPPVDPEVELSKARLAPPGAGLAPTRSPAAGRAGGPRPPDSPFEEIPPPAAPIVIGSHDVTAHQVSGSRGLGLVAALIGAAAAVIAVFAVVSMMGSGSPDTTAPSSFDTPSHTAANGNVLGGAVGEACLSLNSGMRARTDNLLDAMRAMSDVALTDNPQAVVAAGNALADAVTAYDGAWSAALTTISQGGSVAEKADAKVMQTSIASRSGLVTRLEQAVASEDDSAISSVGLQLISSPLAGANVIVSKMGAQDACSTVAAEFDRLTTEAARI